jgi:hypothetical protein
VSEDLVTKQAEECASNLAVAFALKGWSVGDTNYATDTIERHMRALLDAQPATESEDALLELALEMGANYEAECAADCGDFKIKCPTPADVRERARSLDKERK